MRAPAAKSLVLDLLGTMRRTASMPVAALIEAAGLFGIPQNNVRVALVRLREAGLVASDERGRYRLGAEALPLGLRVRGWRDLDRRTRAWRGEWIGVHVAGGDRAARRRRRRAVVLGGFAALTEGLFIRADNLTVTTDDLRIELRALGLPPDDVLVRFGDLDEATERRARALWDVDALQRGYRESLARVEASAARLGRLGEREAMVESFLVGGAVLRELARDPLLPDAICPRATRDALVARMRDYDRRGRAAWAPMLARHDVPHQRAPVDARLDVPALRRSA